MPLYDDCFYNGYDSDDYMDNHSRREKTIRVDPKWHRHIIGKEGCNIRRIKSETNTTIDIPPRNSDSNIITINGRYDQVCEAEKEILKIVKQYADNDKSRWIMIDHQHHGKIIGQNGQKMREIRQLFPKVKINVPEFNLQSDKITLCGPKADIDRCYVYMERLKAEFAESSFELQVTVPKRFYGSIIGSKGSTINNIKSETNTVIDVPGRNSSSEVIRIKGRKEDTEAARAMIQSIIEEKEDETPRRKPTRNNFSKSSEVTSIIPSHWPKGCTIGQRIAVESNKYNSLKQNFIKSIGIDVEVTMVNEICNVEFYEKYQGKKKNMHTTGELQLYHGTEHSIVQPICVQNFDFRLCGKNAVVYGKGSYFARDASYSHRYTTEDSKSIRYMFVADVLVGRFTKGSSEMVRPPLLPHSNHQLYDSCVDNISNPSIYVIFERDQCYPRYLISYKVKKAAATRSSTAAYPSSYRSSHPTHSTPTYQSSASVPATNRSSVGNTTYNASTYQSSNQAPASTRSSTYASNSYTTPTFQQSYNYTPTMNYSTTNRSSSSTSATYNASTIRQSSSVPSYTSSQQREKKSKCVLM